MKKTKSKSISGIGKFVIVALAISLFSAGYSAEDDSSSNWDTVQEKVSDAGDAVATKTKKAYYKTKDAMSDTGDAVATKTKKAYYKAKDAISDTGDAVATKTKKAYYKAKDAITPDPSEEISEIND